MFIANSNKGPVSALLVVGLLGPIGGCRDEWRVCLAVSFCLLGQP